MVRFATGRMQNFRAATMWGGQRDLNLWVQWNEILRGEGCFWVGLVWVGLPLFFNLGDRKLI